VLRGNPSNRPLTWCANCWPRRRGYHHHGYAPLCTTGSPIPDRLRSVQSKIGLVSELRRRPGGRSSLQPQGQGRIAQARHRGLVLPYLTPDKRMGAGPQAFRLGCKGEISLDCRRVGWLHLVPGFHDGHRLASGNAGRVGVLVEFCGARPRLGHCDRDSQARAQAATVLTEHQLAFQPITLLIVASLISLLRLQLFNFQSPLKS
jgi:hypothetical protein